MNDDQKAIPICDCAKTIEQLKSKLKIAEDIVQRCVDRYFDIPEENMFHRALKESKLSLDARKALSKIGGEI